MIADIHGAEICHRPKQPTRFACGGHIFAWGEVVFRFARGDQNCDFGNAWGAWGYIKKNSWGGWDRLKIG